MRVVAPALPLEVDAGVAGVVGRSAAPVVRGPEVLEAGGGLDERAVDGEVLVREQPPRLALGQDRIEEALGHLVPQGALAVLAEDGGIEAGVGQLHVQEPAEE